MTDKFAMVFPGQGSQSVGMLKDITTQFPVVQETFAQASTALNYDLWKIVQNGPAEQLNQTEITQPALLTASIALWRIWQQSGAPNPIVMAGHSLGEYSALVCAGVLEFTDAVKLVAERGRCMQRAVPEDVGAMAAIVGLSNDLVEQWCKDISEKQLVSPANYNAPGQLVIAGYAQAVDQVIELAKNAGAKIAKRLQVSVPSHCALMKNATEQFSHYLNDIKYNSPQIPVIQNADLGNYIKADDIKQALLKQLECPVRWTETIELLADQFQINSAIECGPGKVLCGLIKRIDSNVQCISMSNIDGVNEALKLNKKLLHL